MKEYKYALPPRQVSSGTVQPAKSSDETTYLSLRDVEIRREPVTIMGDEALTMEEHRRILERTMRLPSHMVISQKGDLARAYRQSFDPDAVDIHRWLFLFDEIEPDELKVRRGNPAKEYYFSPRTGKAGIREPAVPPVDETFLKEIAKQVWVSVLPENRK